MIIRRIILYLDFRKLILVICTRLQKPTNECSWFELDIGNPYTFPFPQDHHAEDPLRRGLKDVGPLPDANPQEGHRPALPLRDREADHLHQHRARRGGRGHHRRRVNTINSDERK